MYLIQYSRYFYPFSKPLQDDDCDDVDVQLLILTVFIYKIKKN